MRKLGRARIWGHHAKARGFLGSSEFFIAGSAAGSFNNIHALAAAPALASPIYSNANFADHREVALLFALETFIVPAALFLVCIARRCNAALTGSPDLAKFLARKKRVVSDQKVPSPARVLTTPLCQEQRFWRARRGALPVNSDTKSPRKTVPTSKQRQTVPLTGTDVTISSQI